MSLLAPETIDLCSLPWTPLRHYRALPNCPGLYFVITSKKQVRYIGRTKDFRNRWVKHHRIDEYLAKGEYGIAWLEISDIDLLPALEKACLAYFKPPDNRSVGRPRSNNGFIRTTVLLPPELLAWAEEQPEGLNGILLYVLTQELRRRKVALA